MSTISTSGIAPNSIIRSEHLLRIINALSNKENTDILISGSLSVTGSINGTYLGLGGNNNYSNIALGNSALQNNTIGYNNTAIGSSALYSNITGNNNIATGDSTLWSNTTGNSNIATGYQSLYNNTTGGYNIATGYNALFSNTTGYYNIATGPTALFSNTTGEYNIATGVNALFSNTTGTFNTAIGLNALFNNTTGGFNTAIGGYALLNNTTGTYNTAIGTSALQNNTIGYYNTAIGYNAGYNLTTGYYNIFLGENANTSFISGSNQIVIGYNAQSNGPNTITLGNSSITGIYSNVTTITSLSDQRDKSEIKELTLGLDFIKDLKPVSYTWTRRDGSFEGVQDLGFIAQELDQTQQKFNSEEYTRLVDKKDPEKYYADYMRTYPILVKAVQELSQQVEILQNELNIIKNK